MLTWTFANRPPSHPCEVILHCNPMLGGVGGVRYRLTVYKQKVNGDLHYLEEVYTRKYEKQLLVGGTVAVSFFKF